MASLARAVNSVYRARSSALLDEPVLAGGLASLQPHNSVHGRAVVVASAAVALPVPEQAPLQPHASVHERAAVVASAAVAQPVPEQASAAVALPVPEQAPLQPHASVHERAAVMAYSDHPRLATSQLASLV